MSKATCDSLLTAQNGTEPDPIREALALLSRTSAGIAEYELIARRALAAFDREREERDRLQSRVQRLERAIHAVVTDGESKHPGGWGPDVTTLRVLQDALRGEAEVDDDE